MKLRLLPWLWCAACLSGCSAVRSAGTGVLDVAGLRTSAATAPRSSGAIAEMSAPNPEEEYYIGRAVAARILARFRALPGGLRTRYLSVALEAIVGFSPRPETFGGYHLAVLDEPQPDAVSAPGGLIFVSRGMLDLLDDEDMLAGLLAHEAAHVALRHGVHAISAAHLHEALGKLPRGAAAAASSLSCGVLLEGAGVVFGAAVDDVVSALLDKGYSRDQELEADRLAAEILRKAGYGSDGLARLLQALEHAGAGQGGWRATHPAAAERLAALRDAGLIDQPADGGSYERRRARFLEARARG